MAVVAFIRGIPPGNLRVQTQIHKCQKMATATDFATHYENAELEGGVAKKPTARALLEVGTEEGPEVAESPTVTPRASRQTEPVKSPTPHIGASRTDVADDKLEALIERLAQMISGGQEGHISLNCPTKKLRRRSRRKPKSQKRNRWETKSALSCHQGAGLTGKVAAPTRATGSHPKRTPQECVWASGERRHS